MKLGAVLAFNGEALSNVDLKMSRRAGEIRSLGLSAKIGRDGMLNGELHGQPDGRQVVFLRTSDAGALFRATDVYKRMIGGQMAMVMDAPSADNPMQQGTLNVRNLPSMTKWSCSAPRPAARRTGRSPRTTICNSPACGSILPARPAGLRCATAWCAARCSAARSTE